MLIYLLDIIQLFVWLVYELLPCRHIHIHIYRICQIEAWQPAGIALIQSAQRAHVHLSIRVITLFDILGSSLI